MIDERHEELAALYALDLLEGAERASFEAALARDPALQALVRELREAGASLAHAAPAAVPPSALRARVLASISARATAAPDNIIRPPLSVFRQVLPWGIAACFALACAWLSQLYMVSRSEAALLREAQSVAALSLRATEQQLATEQLLAKALFQSSEKQLADLRTQVTQRDGQLADLTARLKLEGDIANLKITALASKLNNSPEALAIAVWNPLKQEGILKVEKLPALAADKDYQLWVVDPQYPNPVDGGVFTVDPVTGEARVQFKSKQPIKSIAAFAVTLERKGGVPKAEGPFVLLGAK